MCWNSWLSYCHNAVSLCSGLRLFATLCSAIYDTRACQFFSLYLPLPSLCFLLHAAPLIYNFLPTFPFVKYPFFSIPSFKLFGLLYPKTQLTMKEGFVVQDGYVFKEETHLTVLKTSLFFAGDGFTVYDCNGQVVFRVDSYGPDTRDKDELVLMDPHGRCLLTVRRKRPSLHQRWEGFKGERMEGDKPIFSVKRSSIIGRSRACLTVEVYDDNPGEEYQYQIEGCFSQRCCTVFNPLKESVAEIRRKVDKTTSVMLGKEVFTLCVKPGFDGAFAMGLVLILDQINGDDYVDNGTEPAVHPTTED